MKQESQISNLNSEPKRMRYRLRTKIKRKSFHSYMKKRKSWPKFCENWKLKSKRKQRICCHKYLYKSSKILHPYVAKTAIAMWKLINLWITLTNVQLQTIQMHLRY